MKGNKHFNTHFRGHSRPSCVKILYAAFFPFLLALVVGLHVFRSGGEEPAPIVTRNSRGVLESTGHEGPSGCLPGSDCAVLATVAVGGEGGNATIGADQEPPKEPLFLFIGILSGRGYRHRRLAVREAWANRAQIPGLVVSKFILSEDERTPQVQKELEMYNDIVFVKEKTNYKSILYKTFYVLEWGVKHFDVKFVFKTDDDAFINVEPLISQLRLLCESKDCDRERLYLGRMVKHSEVLLQPGHKWNNAVFHNHTGLKVYPNYMLGGGYVMSGEVCRVLVDVHARMPLKFTPIEDATLGFWLMSMDLRHIDHPRFNTWAAPCCFKAPVRKQGQRIVTRFQLSEDVESELCSADPWLVLHKIDSPTKMRYVGAKVANCSYAQFEGSIPSSIEQHVPEEKVLEWRRLHPQPPPRSDEPKAAQEEATTAAAEMAAALESDPRTAGATAAAAANGAEGTAAVQKLLAAANAATAGAEGSLPEGAAGAAGAGSAAAADLRTGAGGGISGETVSAVQVGNAAASQAGAAAATLQQAGAAGVGDSAGAAATA